MCCLQTQIFGHKICCLQTQIFGQGWLGGRAQEDDQCLHLPGLFSCPSSSIPTLVTHSFINGLLFRVIDAALQSIERTFSQIPSNTSTWEVICDHTTSDLFVCNLQFPFKYDHCAFSSRSFGEILWQLYAPQTCQTG